MKKFLLGLFLILSISALAKTQKTILAIFAHPDDESAVSEFLIKYARLGHKIIVMIATDGKDGTRVTKIPAGDSLGAIRKQESICACKIMGIEPPVFLSIQKLDTKIGTGKYFSEHKRLRELLRHHISSINPDIIITFGPDGDTHHSEHIVIGSAVTELLLEQGWVDKYPLYYMAWTESGLMNDLGIVNSKYLNIKIRYSPADELKGLEAYKCYQTQFTPEEILADSERKLKDSNNIIYFRRLAVHNELKNDFFEEADQATNINRIQRDVMKAGRNYNSLMERLKSETSYEKMKMKGDIAALDSILATEYIYTSRQGEVSGKKESFEEYRDHKFTKYRATIREQEVRVINEYAAVETGAVHYSGIQSGKPFDITKRYTTTWIFRDGRWQILSDHTSKVEH